MGSFLMKLPILITEKNGDVTICASVHEAEMEMEPIDVEHGEYVVSDADGLPLSIGIVTEEAPIFWGLWKCRVKRVRIIGALSEPPPLSDKTKEPQPNSGGPR